MNTVNPKLLFKATSEREEYEKYADPTLVEECDRFVAYSISAGLPYPVVTCCGRTPEENGGTPGAVKNSDHLLDPANGDTSFEAIDFRIRHYNPDELHRVVLYWKTRAAVTNGEVYLVNNLNHGTAPHLHIGVRIKKEKQS